jgi:hypothetical protein
MSTAVTLALQDKTNKLAAQVVEQYFADHKAEILDKMALYVETWLDVQLEKVLDRFLEQEVLATKEELDG